MNHEGLVKTAKDAIKAVFNDRTVSAMETVHDLESFQDEIEILIDSLGVVRI